MITIILVSHSYKLGLGLKQIIEEMVAEVEVINCSGCGINNQEIGTDMTKILSGLNTASNQQIALFFDIGSSYLSSKMAIEYYSGDKQITIFDTAIVEGAFTAAVEISGGVNLAQLEGKLKKLEINKIN